MGDKVLTLLPGSANAPLLAAGSQMRTSEPTDYGAIINKFTTVANNAEVITGALAEMSLQIKNGNGSISRLLYKNDLAMGLEGTMNNAKSITGSMQDIVTQIKSGKGSIGSLLYTDSLSNGVNRTVSSANGALVTVQKAADNFSENMRALQGNYFLKGYFKKKAKAQADSAKANLEAEPEIDDAELELIRTNAEKELEHRRQLRLVQPAKNG
jgi:phospholipid/cholesterol/gamma-HCH transport system substrate-binding protein